MSYNSKCKTLITFLFLFILSLSPKSVLGQGWLGMWKVKKILKNNKEKSLEKMEMYVNMTKDSVNRIFYYTEKDKCTTFFDDILKKKKNKLTVDAKDSGKSEIRLEKNKGELIIDIQSEDTKLILSESEILPSYISGCSKK